MQTIEKAFHAPMPFTAGGQTISDRLTAAKHSLAGSQLGKSICKATTEECMGPKKKHLDYLLHCTHEPNVSIPQLANLLIERTQNEHWCVVFKSLITIHNLMCYGNERFTQYLASCNANFNVGNFLDKTSVQGYDMSTHVRRYGKYISEKIYTYRLCAFDFCKVKRGRDDGLLRTMHTEKLLKTIPILQGQIDALLEFQASPQELSNGVINSCFILLFRDLIRLFACYNDGIINLLEKYFDMNKKQCKEALNMYKAFLVRMDKVAEFMKVAESVGIDKGEIPDLARAPNSLLEALEQHLNSMEGGKGSNVTSPTTNAGTSFATTQSAISQFSSGVDAVHIDDSVKERYLQEEQEHLNALKSQQRIREMELTGNAAPEVNGNAFNPFIETSVNSSQPQPSQTQQIDDLLSLDFGAPPPTTDETNPFVVGGGAFHQSPVPPVSTYYGAQPPQGYGTAPTSGTGDSAFTANFSKAFGEQQQNQDYGLKTETSYEATGPLPRTPSGGNIQSYTPLEGNTNPFLSSVFGDSDIADDAWAAASEPLQYTTPFGDVAHGDSSDDGNVPEAVGAQLRNPFSALQQNAQALQGADEVHTSLGSVGSVSTPLAPPVPSSTPEPPSIGQQHQMAGMAVGRPSYSPAVGTITPSPSPVPSPQPMGASAPMSIPRPTGQHLNIYDQTPFSNMDASYTSSPQLPRHMMDQQQPTPPVGSPATVQRSGLDPLGDLLAPSSVAGTTPMQQQFPKKDSKLLKSDLDSSLASLAENLTIEKGGSNKPVQWRPVAPTTMPAQPPGMWNPMQQSGMAPMYGVQPGWGGQMMPQQMQMPQGYYGQPGMAPMQGMGPRPAYGVPPQQVPGQQQQQAPNPFGGLQ